MKALYAVVMVLLLAPCALAADFDNVKEFDTEMSDYGTISIINWFGVGGEVAEYTLTDNSDVCLVDCYAEGEAVLNDDGALFSEFRFVERFNGDSDVDYAVSIREYASVLEKEETCEWVETVNGTVERCTDEMVDVTRPVMAPYDGRILAPGIYHWRIDAKKNPHESIDWIGSAFGVDMTEWAWWNSTWTKSRTITFTDIESIERTDSFVLVNLSVMENTTSYWQSNNFRVLENGATEVPYQCWNGLPNNLTNCRDANAAQNFGFLADTYSNGSYKNYAIFYANTTAVPPGNATLINWFNLSDSTVSSDNPITISQTAFESGYITWRSKSDLGGSPSVTIFPGTGDTSVGIYCGFASGSAYQCYNDGSLTTYQTAAANTYYTQKVAFTAAVNESYNLYNLTTYQPQVGGIKFRDASSVVFTEVNAYSLSRGAAGSTMTYDYLVMSNLYDLQVHFDNLSPYIVGDATTSGINVSLNSPANATYFSSSSVTFNCSAEYDGQYNITNITLNIDSAKNYTVAGNANLLTLESAVTNLPEGTHTWNCTATDSANVIKSVSPRTFYIDTVMPSLVLNNHSALAFTTTVPVNTTWNLTASDSNLNSVILQSNGTNYTLAVDGSGNYLGAAILYPGTNIVRAYAADSAGNLNLTARNVTLANFSYAASESSDSLIVGETNTLSLGINFSMLFNVSAFLVWNNTNYGQGTKTVTGNNTRMVNAFITPTGINSTIAYYWNMSANGTFIGSYNDTQSVTAVNMIVNCTQDYYNQVVLNFSFYEEPTWGEKAGNFTSTFSIFSDNRAYNSTFNVNYYNKESFIICLSPPNKTFNADASIEYWSSGYARREYYLLNATINSTANATQYVGLYLISSTDSDITNVYTYDPQDQPIPNRYVFIERKDVSTNTYRLVTIAKTDDFGHGVTSLRQDDAFYRFIVKSYPNIVEFISEPSKITSTNIYLYPALTTLGSLLNTLGGIQHSLKFNPATLTFTGTFSSDSNTMVQGCLMVLKRNQFRTTKICDTCLYAASGSVDCTIDNSTGEYTAQFYNKLNPLGIWDALGYVSSVGTKLRDKLGVGTCNLIAFAILVTIALVTSFSPSAMVLCTTIGVAVVIAFGLLTLTLQSFVYIVILAIILIARLKT